MLEIILMQVSTSTCRATSIIPHRNISTSLYLLGGKKVNRKKQNIRNDNPHLPKHSNVAKFNNSKDKALANLDKHYGEFFGSKWNSMRLALLSRPKYCALVNNFANHRETVLHLKSLGCFDVGEKFAQNSELLDPSRAKFDAAHDEKVKCDVSSDNSKNDESKLLSDKLSHDVDVMEEVNLDVVNAMERYIDPDEKIIGEMSSTMYDFVPTSSLKGMDDFVEDSDYYGYLKTEEIGTIKPEIHPSLTFPENLRVMMHPRSTFDLFSQPRVDKECLNLNYYCMDGGSILPVIALDVKDGDNVLDMCAAPGGKSLAILQTLLPSKLVCNEKNGERLSRMTSIFEQYYGGARNIDEIRECVTFTKRSALHLFDYGVYDKVICDVPCFSDRHSLSNEDQNLFASKMAKNRLLLPEQQCDLLKSGLMYLKPGGALVYSTCTLSPIQNEGVINMAIKAMAQETTLKFVVNDLTSALKPLTFVGNIFGKEEGISLGNLVVPNICSNFGPTYFCRIVRES